MHFAGSLSHHEALFSLLKLPKTIYGKPSKYGRYDLMSVLMIRLPNHEPEGKTQDPVEKMLAALYTIFKAEKTPEEKCKDLKNRYGIGISTEFENEVRTMCNFSEAILERGIEQGAHSREISNRAYRKSYARDQEGMRNKPVNQNGSSAYLSKYTWCHMSLMAAAIIKTPCGRDGEKKIAGSKGAHG